MELICVLLEYSKIGLVCVYIMLRNVFCVMRVGPRGGNLCKLFEIFWRTRSVIFGGIIGFSKVGFICVRFPFRKVFCFENGRSGEWGIG